MQTLKTYLLEGLIQAALLLSLCGVRVQVEPEGGVLEQGPTSALPPLTHLHNLRNALDKGGTGLHPKSPDLDQFFTARRLLGWVRSLDRLQVPQTELETWLVQQDPAPLPVSLLHSAPSRLILPQPTARAQGHEWEEPGDEWVEPGEEWEEPELRHTQVDGRHVETADLSETQETQAWAEGDTEETQASAEGDAEEGQAQDEQSSASLQECLRLLENFPLTPQQQVCPPGPPRTEGPPTDTEQHWQDLIDLMEPQSADMDMLDLLEQASQAQVVPQAEEQGPQLDGYLGLLDAPGPRLDQELLPLLPSDQLDEPPSAPVHTAHAPRRLSLLPEDLPPSLLLDEGDLVELLGDTDMLEDLLELDLQEDHFSDEMTHRLQQEGYLDPELTQRTSRLSLRNNEDTEGDTERDTEENVERRRRQTEEFSEEETRPGLGLTTPADEADELDSDSGLSLDSSRSPPSPSDSEASSYSSSSSSSSSPVSAGPSPMELGVTIKEEPLDEEELGAVGGYFPEEDSKHVFSSAFLQDQKLFNGLPWLQQVTHDHTYNQPSHVSPKTSARPLRASPKHHKPYRMSKHLWDRDERRARALKIPFSNELIVNLPVDDFNQLLARSRLNEDQLGLIRDIRRRGKNKIAAQNCRKRKLDTLTGLDKDVSLLRRRRTQLLKERQEALRSLQELKQRVNHLYHDVFSSLRDHAGRPLDANHYTLSFQRDGSVDLVSRRQGKEQARRRHKDKK